MPAVWRWLGYMIGRLWTNCLRRSRRASRTARVATLASSSDTNEDWVTPVRRRISSSSKKARPRSGPEPLRRQLRLLADRSVRYIRIRQYGEPAHWADAGDIEHPAILRAVAEGDRTAAIAALAHHLAGTALRVLADSAPSYAPTAVPRAVALAEKT